MAMPKKPQRSSYLRNNKGFREQLDMAGETPAQESPQLCQVDP